MPRAQTTTNEDFRAWYDALSVHIAFKIQLHLAAVAGVGAGATADAGADASAPASGLE